MEIRSPLCTIMAHGVLNCLISPSLRNELHIMRQTSYHRNSFHTLPLFMRREIQPQFVFESRGYRINNLCQYRSKGTDVN